MYKLVAVAGKLRGEEFVLENGENVVGREDDCTIHLPIRGVSKRHMSITVAGDAAYLKDLGSSNGTFVNGKIVKSATIENGDKVVLPDVILQLVYVKEKKVRVEKKVAADDDDRDPFEGGVPPKPLPAKLRHMFKYKLMKIFHGINEEYEWRVLLAILFCLFVIVNVSLTIVPALQDSKRILLNETALRGSHYAEEIGRINSRALEQKKLANVDTNFLTNEPGVERYELFDMEGRIVRPIEKLNSYINDTFSVQAKEWAQANQTSEATLKKLLDDGEIGIARTIVAFNPNTSRNEAVGIIAIRFKPTSLQVESAKSQKAYMEALTTAGLVAIFFFAVVYYLTIRPLEEISHQVDEALRGKRKSLESKYLMGEVGELRNVINTLLQRIRELQNQEDDFEEEESDEPYVHRLTEFMLGAGVPAIVLDSEKKVKKINETAEDLVGIREERDMDSYFDEVTREKGLAAQVIELCDRSSSNGGTNQQGDYELGGHDHEIHVVSLIGKDNFAKAFYITFIRSN